MKHRYSIWKPQNASRTRLIISNDGGNRYEQIAVFSNEESIDKFDLWISEVLRETRELIEPTVKHGHWDNKIIEFGVPRTVARCSNCKGKIWVYAENYEVKYPYCPLCGAKMDEVTDETD